MYGSVCARARVWVCDGVRWCEMVCDRASGRAHGRASGVLVGVLVTA